MKLLKTLTTITAVVIILTTSCKKDSPPPTKTNTQLSGKPETEMGQNAQAKLKKLRASMAAGFKKPIKKDVQALLSAHPQYRNMARRALGIEPTACEDPTPLRQWLSNQITDWDYEVIFFVNAGRMLDYPFLHTVYFENSAANQYFGANGEYTHIINKTFKDLKRFANIQTDGLIVVGMHGNVLRDRNKMIEINEQLYYDDPVDAEMRADQILWLLDRFPQFRNGDHPIFSFNAFSYSPNAPGAPVGTIPNKIGVGDGILSGFAKIGFGDIAPQAILAHEFAHEVQSQLNLFDGQGTPEATRRNELMADAYSAYYLSHARGASMQWKRVKQFLQVFFNIGDCSFDSSNHHGTPAQRMAAANWGYNLANNAQKQGHILTSQQFAALFAKQLPVLVAR